MDVFLSDREFGDVLFCSLVRCFFWWGRVLNKSWYTKNRWNSRCIKNPGYLLCIGIGDEILGSILRDYNKLWQKRIHKRILPPQKKNLDKPIGHQKNPIGYRDVFGGCRG